MFNTSFETFKDDKEVVEMLTLEERGIKEGLHRGRQEGLHEGMTNSIKRIDELMEEGFSYAEAKQKIAEETGLVFA